MRDVHFLKEKNLLWMEGERITEQGERMIPAQVFNLQVVFLESLD